MPISHQVAFQNKLYHRGPKYLEQASNLDILKKTQGGKTQNSTEKTSITQEKTSRFWQILTTKGPQTSF